jgi:hypothetical protein
MDLILQLTILTKCTALQTTLSEIRQCIFTSNLHNYFAKKLCLFTEKAPNEQSQLFCLQGDKGKKEKTLIFILLIIET